MKPARAAWAQVFTHPGLMAIVGVTVFSAAGQFTLFSYFAPYYSQVLTWTGCGGGAQCATAIAPLDWDNPGEGDDIELALVRHPATGGEAHLHGVLVGDGDQRQPGGRGDGHALHL